MKYYDLWMIALCLIIPFICFFYSGVIIKRHEKCISAFYLALREKFPHSYVKQNKIVMFIRSRHGMETYGSVHWMICFYHYLQIVIAFSPIFTLILPFLFPLEKAIVMCFVIGLGPFGLISIIDPIFLIVQIQKCKKIKKENPKYSKRDFYDWRG